MSVISNYKELSIVILSVRRGLHAAIDAGGTCFMKGPGIRGEAGVRAVQGCIR